MIQAVVIYNSNYIFVEFPCSESELEAKFIELYATEYSDIPMGIEEIREPEFLSVLEKQLVSLDQLNYLAKRLTQIGEEGIEKFKNMREQFQISDMKGLINLTFNQERDIASVDEMEEVYNGQTFPKNVPDDCLCVVEMSYEDKTEYLYLPCESMAIYKASIRLPVFDVKNCEFKITDYESLTEEQISDFEKVIEEKGIYALNDELSLEEGMEMTQC